MGRLLALVAAAAAAFAQEAGQREPERAQLFAPSAIQARPLAQPEVSPPSSPAAGGRWGGRVQTRTGEVVSVWVSSAYRRDAAVPRRVANFLASLLHGAELSTLTVYIEPPREVARDCGASDARGCYWADQRLLVAPGTNLRDGTSAETILAHEYGHHVAAAQVNAPWSALHWGTKRWASRQNVCLRTRDRTAFPGDSGEYYRLNPGEAFAETYRLLNFRRLSRRARSWNVNDSWYPDDASYRALREDIVRPWRGPTLILWRGRLVTFEAPRRPGVHEVRVVRMLQTPLDGALTARLVSGPPGARLSLVDGGRTVATAPAGAVRHVVCGDRSLGVAVTGAAGSGFEVEIAVP